MRCAYPPYGRGELPGLVDALRLSTLRASDFSGDDEYAYHYRDEQRVNKGHGGCAALIHPTGE